MTLRKITVDNSVRYVPKSEQAKESKPHFIKSGSRPRNQNKKFSQSNKKFLENMPVQGFAYLKWIMNCYF